MTSLPGAVDPVEAFLRALCLYLQDRGHILFPMLEVSGQQRVRIALLGLYRRHDAEETGYLRFEDVVAALLECSSCMERLRREAGLEGFEETRDGVYAVFSVEALRRLRGRCRSRAQ